MEGIEVHEPAPIFKKLGILGRKTRSKTIDLVQAPPLHALIVGIDEYAHIQNLSGAVKDAETFFGYLTRNLSVPESQIKILLNNQATRQNMIDGFRGLQENDSISKGDPIVIFYAGHGTKLKKPDGWEAGEDFIQALVPQDVKEGGLVTPIPDRTIATLLNNLADKKGDNVTVIFDCCHSTSGTRHPASSGRFARYVSLHDFPPLPANIDEDVLPLRSEKRHAAIAKGFAYQELRSHVLLAACGADELAYETDGAGDFTSALVKTLIESGADKTTYKGCIQRLPALQKQNPQCEGFNKERIFFNAKIPGANRNLILVKKEGEKCFLSAGIAQNITTGAKFNIFNTDIADPTKDKPLGSMRVVHSDATRSTMTWDDDTKIFNLPDLSYGFQTHCGSNQFLKVHFTDMLLQRLSVDEEWHTAFTASQTNIVIKPSDRGTADLIVDLHQQTGKLDRVSFDIQHALVNRHGINELPQTVPLAVEDILAVLRASALWVWHLNRKNPESSLENSVKIEFTRVERGRDRKLGPIGEDLNKSGVVDLVANPQELYGMRLVNTSPYNLFPCLFYFDVNGQSIELWNDSVVGKSHADAPLPKGNFLTIGYGAGGAVPFAFEVDKDKNLELGMLKLYVTNLSTEFNSIAHDSPFDFDPDGKRKSVPSTDVARSLAMRGVWHAVTVALIQHKPTPSNAKN